VLGPADVGRDPAAPTARGARPADLPRPRPDPAATPRPAELPAAL